MISSKRIFIASLDGATWDVLRPLIEQGCMPNLAGLISRGAATELESVVPPVTAPAWTSFMTGKGPGSHGIFDFTRFDEREYDWKINNSQHIRSKTIWRLLSQEGKRVAVINLPYTYPPYAVNGVMVSGWDAAFPDRNFTYPQELGAEILATMPDYAANLDLPLRSNRPTESPALFDRFTRKLIRGAEQGAELALRLLRSGPWDVFMVHFQQTDWLQHNLWDHIERACRQPGDHGHQLDRVRFFYRRLDECIGRLAGEAEEQGAIRMLLSDHGFARDAGTINPNYYLKKWGFLCSTLDSPRASLKLLVQRADSLLRRRRLKTSTAAEGGGLRHNENGFGSFAESESAAASSRRSLIDWSRTKAALVVGTHTGLLFVNLKGRSPAGTVEPGIEYDRLVRDLIARFENLAHPGTGAKLFARVVRGAEIYRNAAKGVQVPDVVLIPPPGYTCSYDLRAGHAAAGSHGVHHPVGVLVVAGDGVKAPPDRWRPCLVDLAPTILHLQGLPVPRDMEGRVLTELFATAEPAFYDGAESADPPGPIAEYSAEETALIEERLKNLGYIG